MRAGPKTRRKEPKMTKKSETFFVWRTTWNGQPQVKVTESAEMSRIWLEASIEETDPFQGIATRLWLDFQRSQVAS